MWHSDLEAALYFTVGLNDGGGSGSSPRRARQGTRPATAGRLYPAGIAPGSSPVAIGIPARLQSEYDPG